MDYFLQQSIDGFSLGCLYAFIAVGYTMVYGIIKLINFAHGEFFMVGSFVGMFSLNNLLVETVDLPYPVPTILAFGVSLLLAGLGAAVLAVVTERVAYAPFRTGQGSVWHLAVAALFGWMLCRFQFDAPLWLQLVGAAVSFFGLWGLYEIGRRLGFELGESDNRLAALLTALGVSIFLQNATIWTFGSEPRGFPEPKRYVEFHMLDDLAEDPDAVLEQDDRRAMWEGHLESLREDQRDRRTFDADAPPLAPPGRLLYYRDTDGNLRFAARLYVLEPQPAGFLFLRHTKEHTLARPGDPAGPDDRARLRSEWEGRILGGDGGPAVEVRGAFRPVPFSPGGIRLFIVLALAVSTALLWLLVRFTRYGKAMRAVSWNRDAAKLMGINSTLVIALTFFVGAVLAGIGGVIWGVRYAKVDWFMGFFPGLKAFVAAVIGGIGSIPGAVIGGLVLGYLETMATGYGLSAYRDAVAFGLLIVVLVVRPTGIMNVQEGEKV